MNVVGRQRKRRSRLRKSRNTWISHKFDCKYGWCIRSNEGMKEETNNEMDLLLRRLGRRPDESVSGTNGDIDHLDADELNAYAENVLPPAARARYTEHLAACARCRELVVQLSSSAAVVPVVAKTPAPSALRTFLASLF